MVSEALGSIHFSEMPLRCCYTFTDVLELTEHELGHTKVILLSITNIDI